jgi:hypothetical protein
MVEDGIVPHAMAGVVKYAGEEANLARRSGSITILGHFGLCEKCLQEAPLFVVSG